MTIFDVMGEGKCGVRIPKIQRDYAQGRVDAEGEAVRKCFIPKLFDAVFNGNRLVLDFVYGIGCGDDCSSGALMLLDGQQRITTLFLLAWFVGYDVSKWEFSYESRRFADEFVKNLRKKSCTDHLDPVGEIKRREWYLSCYAEDPSVSGSLQMLDSMAGLFRSYESAERQEMLRRADLRNVEFLVKDVSTNDMKGAPFDEIYLKMNARGMPLTDWENIKAIVDKYADDEWRRELADWEESLWLLVPGASCEEKIKNWNIALEKIIRMAASVLWGRYNIDLVELDERVSRDPNFFVKVRQYVICVLDDSFRATWSEVRSENSLWQPKTCDKERLVGFIFANNVPSIALQFRFDSLVESRSWDSRKRRILLNLIDRSNEISVGKLTELISARTDFGVRELSESSIDALAILAPSQTEEKWKLGLDASFVVDLEADELTWNGCIEYLAWKGRSQDDLASARSELRSIVEKSDSGAFFCDLLRDLQCYKAIAYEDDKSNFHSELPFQVTIPYGDSRKWAKNVFYVKRLREALHYNRMNEDSATARKDPCWLKHLRELLAKMWKGGERMYFVRTFDDGWTYLFSKSYTENPKRTASIRLDFNEVERENRKTLLGIDARLHYGDVYRKKLDADVYYNVRDDSDNAWWKTNDLVEYVKVSDGLFERAESAK